MPTTSFENRALGTFLIAIAGLPIYQLLYVIPTASWAKRRQRDGLFKGVVIAAVLTGLGGLYVWLKVIF